MSRLLFIILFLPSLGFAQLICDFSVLPDLPDVRITSVEKVTEPVPHCKAAGIIGPEIRFELLLPENWNGKFVMGGGAVLSALYRIHHWHSAPLLLVMRPSVRTRDTRIRDLMQVGRLTTWSA